MMGGGRGGGGLQEMGCRKRSASLIHAKFVSCLSLCLTGRTTIKYLCCHRYAHMAMANAVPTFLRILPTCLELKILIKKTLE